jgi:hypothetical protein
LRKGAVLTPPRPGLGGKHDVQRRHDVVHGRIGQTGRQPIDDRCALRAEGGDQACDPGCGQHQLRIPEGRTGVKA